jgi:hypothetical protein
MDGGVGATPWTRGRRRASRRAGLGRTRHLVVAAALALAALAAALPNVATAADAGRVVRATDAAIAGPYPCHQPGVSGPKRFGHPRSGVRCGVPQKVNVPCFPPDGLVCLAELTVTVRAEDGHKHDLEAEGVLGRYQSHNDCTHEESCTLKEPLFVKFGCSSYIIGEAIGFQNATYEGPLDLERKAVPAEIRVTGKLTVLGFVPPSRPFAHAAVAGCGATAPLEALVGGVVTDDPLTETPLATGYGDVSVSPPNATVRCPYVTDYRACFGTWRLPLDANVTLRAMPDPVNGSYFAGWRGSGTLDCASSSETCSVKAGQVAQVTALFGAPIYKLTIDNTTNPNLGAVAPSGFSNLGPTPDRLECGAGVNDCTAYYPLVDSTTMPNFNGPAPLSLGQNGIITYDNEQWYIQFESGCDAVQVVLDGSNRYTVCYYNMTADRTVKVDWTTTPP